MLMLLKFVPIVYASIIGQSLIPVVFGEMEKDICTFSWSPQQAQLDPFASTASPSVIGSLESRCTDSADNELALASMIDGGYG